MLLSGLFDEVSMKSTEANFQDAGNLWRHFLGTIIGRSASSRLPGPSMSWGLCLCTIAVLWAGDPRSAQAQLTGHGGPVRAVAVSADGKSVLSGSFDTAAIRWSLAGESAEQVLRFHSDAVNAVAFLKDGRMATAGADARIAVWTAGRQQPDQVFEGHRAPIVALAVSADGSRLLPHRGIARSSSGRLQVVRSASWKAIRRTSTASHSRRTEKR